MAALVQPAFVHTLKATKTTKRNAARLMRVDRSTVLRATKPGGVPINPLFVLRSPRLRGPFFDRLCRLIAVADGRRK